MKLPHLPGITCRHLDGLHLLEAGSPSGVPVVFVHGNLSSATYWEEELLALPEGYRAIAFDLPGYGESAPGPGWDATLGLRQFCEVLTSVAEALGLGDFHLVGHSLGGGIAMQYLLLHPSRLRSVTLVAPAPPYGFCGTKDVAGTPCHPDFAGSGAGMARPEFVERLRDGDRSLESQASPRFVFRNGYGVAPFQPAREEVLLEAMLQTHLGPAHYPGDWVPSPHWPGYAPGLRGVTNCLSPRFFNVSALASREEGPPVLWIRGARDVIVGNLSASDPAFGGMMGLRPDWPGGQVFPFQPMVSQTRDVLSRYGGGMREVVIPRCGHTPFLEYPVEFREAWHPFLAAGLG